MARSLSTGLDVGAEFAGYRIEALIGHGGMGAVYLAEDTRLQRKVALKLLPASLADDGRFREQFLRESRLAASLDHPNVVPIYEAGEADGQLYIAMRYVEGTDLRAALQEGPLEPVETIETLAQVASALDAAHARGLVHRDVKPGNILLAVSPPHTYLADFGLSEHAASHASVESAHGFTGTVDYVAPEQIRGEKIDGRADVYSLGCVLYECLTGVPPFRRDSDLAALWAHVEQDPPSVGDRRDHLPVELDAVIARALAKDRTNRFQSCGELVRAAAQSLGLWARSQAVRRLGDAAARAVAGRSDLLAAEAELAENVADLQRVDERLRAYAEEPAAVAVCPFKGLASFEAADADFFFGRERLVAELVARLVSTRLLGIVGPSGSGKSSVVRAGLLPAIAAGVLPGSERWRPVLLRPGEHPLRELGRGLGGRSLSASMTSLDDGERLFLVVDQLEEVFTVCRDDEERAVFIRELVNAARDKDSRAVVVFAIRADLYGRCAAYPELADLLASHALVGAMQQDELRRAIEQPARRVGLNVEPALADALVTDVVGEPGALPLLSTSLLELWMLREGSTLTLESYRRTGGVQGAVARLAEDAYGSLDEGQQVVARSVLLRFAAVGEGNVAARRRAPLTELDISGDENVGKVVSVLTERRLLTVSGETVEVAHEALLREWPRLRSWLEEDVQGRRLHRHLTESASEWAESGREPAELYRGARLAAALDWTAEHTRELNELEREFVAWSRDAGEAEARRQRRTNRRLRGLLVGVAILLAAAIAGGTFALLQRGQARDAASAARTAAHQARTAEAAQLGRRVGQESLQEQAVARSLLIAREGFALDGSGVTRSYLLTDLLRFPAVTATMRGDGDPLTTIAVSPDGTMLAIGDAGLDKSGPHKGSLFFFDARTHRQIGKPIIVPTDIEALAFSPDGKTLAVGGGNAGLADLRIAHAYLWLLDVRTRQVRRIDLGLAWGLERIAYSREGNVLAVDEGLPGSLTKVDHDQGVIFFDAFTGAPLGKPIHIGPLKSDLGSSDFAFAHDGHSVITTRVGGPVVEWNVERRQPTKTLSVKSSRVLAVSPDGSTLALTRPYGADLIDLRTGALVRAAGGRNVRGTGWVGFSPDGQIVATTSTSGMVALWDATSGTQLAAWRGHAGPVPQAVFNPDGKILYTVGSDGVAIAWDVAGTRGLQRSFRAPDDPRLLHQFVRPGGFSPDGRLIALGHESDGIGLWDAGTLTPDGVLGPTGGQVAALNFSDDGRTLAGVTNHGELTVWDPRSEKLVHGPFAVEYGSPALGTSLSPNGKVLSIGGHTASFWNTTNGDLLFRIERTLKVPVTGNLDEVPASGSVQSVAFSPDGERVAVAGADCSDTPCLPTVEVWDVVRHVRIRTLSSPGATDTMAFSPDGKTLAAGGSVIRLFNSERGALEGVVGNRGPLIASLDFSPDGKTLAAGRVDGSVVLWDVATGVQIGPRLNAGKGWATVDFSPDGKRLLASTGTGQATVWDVDPGSWAKRACAIAGRNLTRAEWRQFLGNRPYQRVCPGLPAGG